MPYISNKHNISYNLFSRQHIFRKEHLNDAALKPGEIFSYIKGLIQYEIPIFCNKWMYIREQGLTQRKLSIYNVSLACSCNASNIGRKYHGNEFNKY